MFNPKRILVTTDFSSESDMAIQEALDIGGKYKSHIYLLHVIPEVEQCAADYCLDASDVMAEKDQLMAQAKKKMKEELARVTKKKTIPVSSDIRFGHASDVIIEVERERGIDLVIAAPHTHKKRAWRLFPHLTETLVNESPAETLVVRSSIH
ncbi:MAG: universal stress protein [Spirochaetes bacterium]|nr:MAG: universal stress protein [Spirochaetota bacterium]